MVIDWLMLAPPCTLGVSIVGAGSLVLLAVVIKLWNGLVKFNLGVSTFGAGIFLFDKLAS